VRAKRRRGRAAAEAAAETARRTFEEGSAGAALPSFAVAGGSIGIVDALIGLGFAKSKGEARRLIAGGGARVDGEKVADENVVIAVGAEPVKLSSGKKNHGLLTAG
jgi:tyrosyl-tRNA synthetase